MSEAALEPHLPLREEGKSSPVLALCPAPTPQLPARVRMPHPCPSSFPGQDKDLLPASILGTPSCPPRPWHSLPHSEVGLSGEGGSLSVRPSAHPGSVLCEVASSLPFWGPQGMTRGGVGPCVVSCTHNKQQNHRPLEVTRLKFSSLG